MSKLDKMIAKLCPDGVEYRRVGDIADYEQPSKYLVKSTDYNDDFEIPVLTAGQTFILGYTNEKEGIYNASSEKPVIIFDDFTGAFKWVDFPFKAKSSAMKMITSKSDVLIRYLFHLMGFLNYSSDEHKRLWISVYSELQVPVPPLEVQREIVHILDSFTLLTAELTAELTARKKQYEFYRDELLSAKKNIPIVKLGDIAIEFYRGSGIKRDEITDTGIPCIRYGEIYTTYNTWFNKCVSHTKIDFVQSPKYFENGDILFAITGESVEDIAKSVAYIGHEKCLAGGDIVVMKHNQNPRYLAHVLATTEARMQKSKGKVKSKVVHSNVPSIKEIQIPLPPLEVQERYANVLDNFESICTDLNIGLPAEIEARQKQYEYYRDLLLTFAEKGNTIMTDRQTDRQTELSAIKLIQYVFGYATVSLDYIVNFRNGKGHEKNIVSNGKYIVVNSKFISTDGKVKKYADEQICPLYVNDILMVMSDLPNGRALAKCYLVDEDDKYTLNQRIGAFTVSRPDLVTTKYLYYILSRNPQLLRYDNGADQTNLRKADILNILIAIPTVKEQKKITEILDRLDTLCNDLSTGLPAEIEARQKQYEYYRDKLLSFKELPK